MSEKVLITGASGLIGSRLTHLLLQKGYQVVHLGRRARKEPVVGYAWDIQKGEMDEQALQGVTSIIHLAGAGIADERWTEARKKEIRESRTRSTQVLFNTLNKARHNVKNFISASAIGYYGFETTQRVFVETDAPGKDFLASVVRDWEQEIDAIERLAIRVVKIRIGIVLSKEGGALKEMARPVKLGVGAPLGNGEQTMSWIHIDDLCRMFLFALENESLHGAYNAVAPTPISNKEFTKLVAKALHKPLWLPPVPAFVVKLLVGEMAALVVNGSAISSGKIEQEGFQFGYTTAPEAVKNLLEEN